MGPLLTRVITAAVGSAIAFVGYKYTDGGTQAFLLGTGGAVVGLAFPAVEQLLSGKKSGK